MTLRDTLRNVWQYAGQVPAGLIQGTVANSILPTDRGYEKGEYRPAIVDQPGAVYGVLKTLAHSAAPSYVGDVKPNTFAGRSMARANKAVERTNATLGVRDPENAAQTGLNILGSLLIPAGGEASGGVAAAKAVTGASRATRVAKTVGKVAAETLVPMRQTGLKTALATQLPLGVGLREGIDALANDDNYHGAADVVRNHPPQVDDEFGDHAVAPADEFGDVAVQTAQPADEFGDLGHATGLVPPESADDHETSTLEKGLLAAAAIGGVGLGLGVSKYALGRIKSGPIPTGELVGTRVVKPGAGVLDRTIAGTVQGDQVARNVAAEYLTPDEAARFNYSSDRIVPAATGAKVQHHFITGQAPGSARKVAPLAPLLEATAKDLSPTERSMVADGLLANSALDDYKANGVLSSFNKAPDGTPITPAQLQQKSDLVANDPKLSKYADAVKQQYNDILQYSVDRGLTTTEKAAEMRQSRPNYVHTSKDIIEEGGPTSLFAGSSPNKLRDEQFSRAVEEGGGVQAGAARDPIDELQGRWSNTIATAEMNDHKKSLIDGLMNSKAANEKVIASDGSSKPLIQQLKGGAPDVWDGVHTVYRDGRAEYYKINSPALNKSLQYAPSTHAPLGLGTLRQVGQFFTTGAGNPLAAFGATVAPVYDALTMAVLRPAGTDIGVINEMINRARGGITNPKMNKAIDLLIGGRNLGRLDPTALLSPFIGGARSMKDEITGAMATTLSEQLVRNAGPALDVLGPNKAQVLRDYLQTKYDSSIRSMMDATGAGGARQYGSNSGQDMSTGLEHIAPAYTSDLSSRVHAATIAGDDSMMTGVLSASRNAFAQAKASKIARMYSAVTRNMQEGGRYQYMATNLPRVKSMAELDKLAAETRRVAVDSAQHGNNEKWQQFADSVMYANVGVQSLAQWGRAFAANPTGTTINLATTIGTLAALKYGSMIADPEVAQRTRDRTDMQNTTAIPIFGGMTLPIEPNYRMITGPLFAFLDKIAMDDDGNFNPHFVDAIYQHFDDHDLNDEHNESVRQATWDAFTSGLQAVNPVAPSSAPIVAGSLALAGVDPGMSRVTGTPQPVRVQSDPTKGDGKYSDSMVSGYWTNLINATIGTGITHLIDAADQGQRALYSRNADGSRGVSASGAAKVALSQLVDDASKSNGPVQGLLFSGYEKSHSIANTDYNIYRMKEDGIKKATQVFREDIRNAYVTGSDPRTALMRPQDLVPADLSQTPLAPIGVIALQLNKATHAMDAHISALGKQVNDVRNQKTTRIEERNRQINEINKERQFWYTRKLQATRMAEDQIQQTIDDPSFTFQSYEPSKYVQNPSEAAPPE